jgi:hypothetical protein
VIETTELLDLIAGQLADTETTWSIGTFGAIAEFTRDAEEAATISRADDMISVVTVRGGLRIEPCRDLRPVASESPTTASWTHRVALCIPEDACAMNRRTVLTEVGADRAALRAEDREAILFDLGLGTLQVDACVRSGDKAVIAALRRCAGKSLFAPDNGAMGVILASNPHRAFLSKVGRIEVFQPIPPPDGRSPNGPHTHVLPKLLAHGRTHAATEPTPAGWIPCAHFYPPHPARDGFGHRRAFAAKHHAAFQMLLAKYGDPQFLDIKRRTVASVVSGQAPSAGWAAGGRFARATVRVALRQLKASEHTSPVLGAWLSAHDRLDPVDVENSTEPYPCPL